MLMKVNKTLNEPQQELAEAQEKRKKGNDGNCDEVIKSKVKLNETVDKIKGDVFENVDRTVKLSIKKLKLWMKLSRK